jgi:hypothetical protein
MLTFENLKEFFILFFTFGIIYLFQYVDDKKRCKKRDGIYDNVKLPLLASAIVGLVLFWNSDSGVAFMNYAPAPAPASNIRLSVPASVPRPPATSGLPAPVVGTNRTNPDFLVSNQQGGNIPTYNIDYVANNLEVYTDLLDF